MNSEAVRHRLVDTLRRDLVGPGPADADIIRERLGETPSRWYLTGFITPADDSPDADDLAAQEEQENAVEARDAGGAGGAAGDDGDPEPATTRVRFLPSSLGLTVLLPLDVTELDVVLTWGDYVTEPPLPASVLIDGPSEGPEGKASAPAVDWVRIPRSQSLRVPVPDGISRRTVPDSAAPSVPGGGLELTVHARALTYQAPEGPCTVRAVSVFVVNRRQRVHRRHADVVYAFQVRLELRCEQGFCPRHDLSGYQAVDDDLRLADLHYRDVVDYAVGRGTAAGWKLDEDGQVRSVHSDPLPIAEVPRVAPNEDMTGVTFDMEALASLADTNGDDLCAALNGLPALYGAWIDRQRARAEGLTAHIRRQTGERLVASMEEARARITHGIALLRTDPRARQAFALMNRAVAAAARRRNAGPGGDPAAQNRPKWRPFQLAFILLNLRSLQDKTSPERELVDLLFFPTGGGKTEAYLGLAAFAIAHRRLGASGVLGAGVVVIMRYTLRLLTLDQLSRAAGVICALELMRTDPKMVDAKGQKLLGDWPIEIGLWVGGDASPNRLGGVNDTGDDKAVTRVRKFRQTGKRAPAPIKACPWCNTPFGRESFRCMPNDRAPTNMEIRCVNGACDFTGNRALPVLTVDEPLYRRLPAFVIATVDKFASLPWVGASGALLGGADRFDPNQGFYGPSETGGQKMFNGWKIDPPDLIIQDELHLISGPLGTVAGLYEAAIDRLSTRIYDGHRVRPKIVASTATVRRASQQIRALFDRDTTAMFPPPGIEPTDSFFAKTVNDADNPPRWYLGLAAQGRGPKLVFLRALTTLLSSAQTAFEAAGGARKDNPADPYMTALCYFNALRELGGARRIVEDEVRTRASRYGSDRRRYGEVTGPFRNRPVGEVLELTSRVNTDKVAEAKQLLESAFDGTQKVVDVALATNMISVGLDITRLGLMLVQGQPKTTAEYIQATSRVGRDHHRPGIVVTVLNLHKPRDRMHYEQFGHYHRTFYRAVEATSVTPWAARALDRALAAVVVTIARHIEPALSPEQAVMNLRDHAPIRKLVADALVARAPAGSVAGGHTGLREAIEGLMGDWITVADEMTRNGGSFSYGRRPQHLLYDPLDPALDNLSPEHQRFTAGRSMRDVEPSAYLKVRDPYGAPIANAADLD